MTMTRRSDRARRRAVLAALAAGCRRGQDADRRRRRRRRTAACRARRRRCAWCPTCRAANGACRPATTATCATARSTRSRRPTSMNLHVVTTFSTGVPHGHEGQPLVFGNTMYVVTPFPNNLIAVDLTKPGGAVKWIYEPHPDQRAVGIACCDVVNRGASLRGRQDHLQPARRAPSSPSTSRPASEVWRTRVGDINRGETFTAAPIVVKDHVLVGNSGGELGVRGYVAALDVEDRQGAVARVQHRARQRREDRPGVPRLLREGSGQGSRRHARGRPSNGSSAARRSGAGSPTTRRPICSSTAPAIPASGTRICVPATTSGRASIIARDADTGEARWAYQVTAHDSWDYDEIMENVLVDMDYGGRRRKLLVHPGPHRLRLRARSRDRRAAVGGNLPADELGERLRPEDRQAERRSGQADALRHRRRRASVPRRPAPRTSSRRRSRRAPACSTSPRTTPAWTTKGSRRTTSPARRISAPT